MDAGPVSGSGKWRLKSPHDATTQGLVVSGFGALPTGRALFLEFGWSDAEARGCGAWLKTLTELAPVTPASGKQQRASALAFTFTGLARMGLNSRALDSFTAPFREGMMQEDRLRRLNDRRKGEWLPTVVDGGPHWSANTPQRSALASGAPTALTATGHTEEQVATPLTVHALLLLYAPNEAEADRWQAEVQSRLGEHRVNVVHQLPLILDVDGQGISREHFGFADGISQPAPFDARAVEGDGATDKWNGIPLGDILFGHDNGHHEPAPGPIVPLDAADPLKAGLALHALPGAADLGLDGSYLVVRELKQDVGAFWSSMERNAARLRAEDPSQSATIDANWLAERAVGRTKDGALLCPKDFKGTPPSGIDNSFGFFDRDPHGAGCPGGSHVRRGNPRDGLAPDKSQADTILSSVNLHRILRRGRKYVRKAEDGTEERGLLFIALNTDIERQFEFVQQTWMMNPNFATLYDETDPLIGPASPMTVRDLPLRRVANVDTFVQLTGGDYFFLPSLPAIRYLETL